MSFLDQLKVQASAVKSNQDQQQAVSGSGSANFSAMLAFRLANLTGFGLANASWPVADVHTSVLDELAKMVCGHQSRFA